MFKQGLTATIAGRLVIAVVLALIAAAPAYAAWDEPARVDTVGEDRGDTSAGEIAVGANGIATVFLFQSTDSGPVAYWRRRAADAASWSDAENSGFVKTKDSDKNPGEPANNPQPELEANDAGVAGVAYRHERVIPGGATGDTEFVTVFGGGWPTGVEVPSSLKQLLGEDQAAAATGPDVDVDADGHGHVVAAYSNDLRYGQFNPATGNKTAAKEKTGFVQHPPSGLPDPDDPQAPDFDEELPIEPATRPHMDVNESGDVAISFAAVRNPAQLQPPMAPNKTDVYVVRKKAGSDDFTKPKRVSHADESDSVTEHDVAIAADGTITVVFASSPEGGRNKLYARRWLGSADDLRPERAIELVSSSAAGRPAVSHPRAVVDDSGNVTAAWRESAQLLAAERTSNWNLPQTLSTKTAGVFDVAVDSEGTGTLVYLEGSSLMGRRRAAGTAWGNAETVSSGALETPAPRVDARKRDQADVFFVKQNGALESAYASRFTGEPPVTPVSPPKPDTEDCPGDVNVVPGGERDDALSGTDDRDSMLGGGGDDSVSGLGGDDCLRGGAGNDRVDGGAGNDSAAGGDGNDRVKGDVGSDTLAGDAGNDTVTGQGDNDAVTGGDGNDTVKGSGGEDLLSGDAGDDIVQGGPADDTAGGADGNDTVAGQGGADNVFGGFGDDKLSGGSAADKLFGEAGADTLLGRRGRDTLRGGPDMGTAFGGRGTDKVVGGKAADRLFGGGGGDVLKGGGAEDRLSGGSGNDKIRAADGEPDRIVCGLGKRDRVVADALDRVSGSCERVRRDRR